MKHRLDVDGIHGEIVSGEPDEHGRLRVLFDSSTPGETQRVMRILPERLLPKAPKTRLRSTETNHIGELQYIPLTGLKKPQRDRLDDLERQAELTEKIRREGPQLSHHRAFAR